MPLPKKKKPKKRAPKLYIGEWIVRLGRERPEVAAAVDLTESYLSELISGKKVASPGMLFAIADELHIGLDSLRTPPPSQLAIEAAERLPPDQLAALGQLLNQIKNVPRK